MHLYFLEIAISNWGIKLNLWLNSKFWRKRPDAFSESGYPTNWCLELESKNYRRHSLPRNFAENARNQGEEAEECKVFDDRHFELRI